MIIIDKEHQDVHVNINKLRMKWKIEKCKIPMKAVFILISKKKYIFF